MTVKKLGRYELIRVLGKGAMGVVYEARDPNLDRRVAIKTVKVENLSEDAASEYEHRFRTEARSAARLQHPNIVSVYDSDRDGNIAFLVMEYIQGDDLKHYLDRGVRYSLEQATRMIRDLLSALEYAHQQGIVHRDVKPANLLIEMGGGLKLTDFGVARIQDSGDATRTQGAMVGTLKYMAPEQVQGLKTDARADLFSAGVVLYQLLTDKRPFDGDNDFSIIQKIISHDPIAPSAINPGLPSAIDAVVARALAKNRDDRFASARDFSVALQAAIRRAEDQSVLPPADPNRIRDESGIASGSGDAKGAGAGHLEAGNATASIGSVTQELELVYWKDVRDSIEAEEIQGFLDKFPAGIYADLARRRLRRLATGSTADQTVLSGASMDAAAAWQAAGESSAHSGDEPTLPQPRAQAAASATTRWASAWPQRSRQAAQKTPWLIWGGVGVLATLVATAALIVAKRNPVTGGVAEVSAGVTASGAPSVSAAAGPDSRTRGIRDANDPAGAVGAAASAPSAASAGPTVPAKPYRSVPGTSIQAAASAPAAGEKAMESGPQSETGLSSAGKRAAATEVVKAPGQIQPASVRADTDRSESKPRTSSSVAARQESSSRAVKTAGANAVDQCRDKFFFWREMCLAEQCEKAAFRNHPLCLKRRQDSRVREESRVAPS